MKTHRKVSIEVVLPVKERRLVYGAVQRQSRHDCCLHASSVENLRRRSRDIPLIRKLLLKKKKSTRFSCRNSNMKLTGSVPGREASKNDTREFGGAEKPTEEPENSLVLDLIWA